MNEFPFSLHKVPVCTSVQEVKQYLQKYAGFTFCLYLAYKDPAAWDISTSRVYMNAVFSNFIYLPTNIKKEDYQALRDIYQLSEQSKQIVAINQTQPHKSNPVLKELFRYLPEIPVNIDTIIKNTEGTLVPYDLNGPSFAGWFNDEVGTFTNTTVVLIGVGGVGEPIARCVVRHKPFQLILINPSSRDQLKEELSQYAPVLYYSSLGEVDVRSTSTPLIVINAAGKEGATDETGIYSLLDQFKNMHHIFVDLRPQLQIDIVEEAKQLGWKAYTGYGMNARNDYTLVLKIAEVIHSNSPSFAAFKDLVAGSS